MPDGLAGTHPPPTDNSSEEPERRTLVIFSSVLKWLIACRLCFFTISELVDPTSRMRTSSWIVGRSRGCWAQECFAAVHRC